MHSWAFLSMTAGICVKVLERGTDGCGRRIKILTQTFTGPAEGWVSVVAQNGNALIAPAGVSASSSKSAPPAKRGHATTVGTDDVEAFYKRRRRFWY